MLQSTLIPLQLAGDVDDQGEALDRCGVSGSRQAIGESGVGCGLAGSDETRVHFRAALDSWISLVRQIGNLGWELLPSSSPVRWAGAFRAGVRGNYPRPKQRPLLASWRGFLTRLTLENADIAPFCPISWSSSHTATKPRRISELQVLGIRRGPGQGGRAARMYSTLHVQ